MVPGVAASLPHMCPYRTDVQLNTDPVINDLIDGRVRFRSIIKETDLRLNNDSKPT